MQEESCATQVERCLICSCYVYPMVLWSAAIQCMWCEDNFQGPLDTIENHPAICYSRPMLELTFCQCASPVTVIVRVCLIRHFTNVPGLFIGQFNSSLGTRAWSGPQVVKCIRYSTRALPSGQLIRTAPCRPSQDRICKTCHLPKASVNAHVVGTPDWLMCCWCGRNVRNRPRHIYVHSEECLWAPIYPEACCQCDRPPLPIVIAPEYKEDPLFQKYRDRYHNYLRRLAEK